MTPIGLSLVALGAYLLWVGRRRAAPPVRRWWLLALHGVGPIWVLADDEGAALDLCARTWPGVGVSPLGRVRSGAARVLEADLASLPVPLEREAPHV